MGIVKIKDKTFNYDQEGRNLRDIYTIVEE